MVSLVIGFIQICQKDTFCTQFCLFPIKPPAIKDLTFVENVSVVLI